jgi:hypothetical protein
MFGDITFCILFSEKITFAEKIYSGGCLMKRRVAVFAAFLVVLTAGSVVLAQKNPFVGTWKLDVASSKYNPGPAPQSQTRTWEASGKVTVDSVGATGKASSYGYTIKGDGKEYPTVGAIPNTADTITSKKVDASSYEAKFFKAGKQVELTTFAVSNGGKTLTIHAKGTSPAGDFDNTMVWSK